MTRSTVPRMTVVSAASAAEVNRSERICKPSLKIGSRLITIAPMTTMTRVHPNRFTARGRTIKMTATAETTSSTEATEDLLPETAMQMSSTVAAQLSSQFLSNVRVYAHRMRNAGAMLIIY